jgi:protein-disulfide isomerase
MHPAAAKAAEAARCAADQGKFREMHDRLFTNQQTLDVKYLPVHAATLGLDPAQFASCLETGKFASLVRGDVEAGQARGVKGTPTFFLGSYDAGATMVIATRQLNGAQPYSTFKENLDKLLSPE